MCAFVAVVPFRSPDLVVLIYWGFHTHSHTSTLSKLHHSIRHRARAHHQNREQNKRVNYEISSVWVHLSVNMYSVRLLFPDARHRILHLFFLIFFLFINFCALFFLLIPRCSVFSFQSTKYHMHTSRARKLFWYVFKWPGAEWFLFLYLYLTLYFGFVRQAHTHTHYA